LNETAAVAKIATIQKEGIHKQKSCHSRGSGNPGKHWH